MNEKPMNDEKLAAEIRLGKDSRIIAKLFYCDNDLVTEVEQRLNVNLKSIEACVAKLGPEIVRLQNGRIIFLTRNEVVFVNKLIELEKTGYLQSEKSHGDQAYWIDNSEIVRRVQRDHSSNDE